MKTTRDIRLHESANTSNIIRVAIDPDGIYVANIFDYFALNFSLRAYVYWCHRLKTCFNNSFHYSGFIFNLYSSFVFIFYMWRFVFIFYMWRAIWYHLYNLKNAKDTHGEEIFFTLFKLYKWYQISQSVAFLY